MSNLETSRTKKSDGCEDNKSWNQKCDPDVPRVAYNASVEDNPQTTKDLEDMTSRLEVLLETMPKLGDV